MKFTEKEMHDLGRKSSSSSEIKVDQKKKYYPSISLDIKQLPDLEHISYGDVVTLHAHGKVTRLEQDNDGLKQFTIELEKAGIKEGLNPRPAWMTDDEFATYEQCLKHLTNKRGINKYAVCTASVKEGRNNAKSKALKKL